MANINIEKAFVTDNKSVYLYLSTMGQGLYIPLYQRDYSWDKDNIIQLQEDIENGISRIVSTQDEQEIRFLGTIITLVESNRDKIYPIEPQIVPSRIEVLIDGQQRLSTIIILTTILLKNLFEIKGKLQKSPFANEINDIYNFWEDKLLPIFTVDIRRKPKPKIIRGNRDFWTENATIEDAYKSPVSLYIAKFIANRENDFKNPYKPTGDEIGKTLFQNYKILEKWIKETVRKAHINNEDFPSALDILNTFNKIDLWNDNREDLVNHIKNNDCVNDKPTYALCEYVQVLSVCHYLLERCCFTVIQPTDENWAFDMFQSLNATGTPLTAIETFKPTVVNVSEDHGKGFKNSDNERYFNKVDDLFEDVDTAQQKNTRTKDFLTSFFVAYNGQQVSSHFSHQRKSLIDAFEARRSDDKGKDFLLKSDFVKFFGNYAEFFKLWLNSDKYKNSPSPLLSGCNDADIATMLIAFLKASNHKMAITVLGNFYEGIEKQEKNALNNFINAVKAVSAYYFLWRSSNSNAGLDVTYRDFFKTEDKSWKFENGITIDELKEHLKKELKEKHILDKAEWIAKAREDFKYESAPNEVIRLGLLIAANDSIIDEANKGLIKSGRSGAAPYLCLSQWFSEDLQSIEHIAPQNNQNNDWDENLYENKLYQSIGNLTLLCQNLNSSAGNRPWEEKILYYKTVGEKDPDKIADLRNTAMTMGIDLKDDTISLLQKSNYNSHIGPIANMAQNDSWDKEMVEKRRDNLLDIIWDKVSKWIE